MSSLNTSSSAGSSKPKPNVNLRSTAVKRIMQEAAELAGVDVDEDGFAAAPLENDIFEWHCTMRGVQNSEFEGGLYHLRIVLPSAYPMQAPDIMLMTPNGRFELGKKICIDGLTSFHAGSWQPAWGVRTAILGLRSFWMQSGEALSAIGALDYSKSERKRLASLSREWKCPICGIRNDEIVPPTSTSTAAVAVAVASGPGTDNDIKVEVEDTVYEEKEEKVESKPRPSDKVVPEGTAVNTIPDSDDDGPTSSSSIQGDLLSSAGNNPNPDPDLHADLDVGSSATSTALNSNSVTDQTITYHDVRVLDDTSTSASADSSVPPPTVVDQPLSRIRQRNTHNPNPTIQTDTPQRPITQPQSIQQTQFLAPPHLHPDNHRARPEPPSRSNSAAQTALLPRRIVPVWLDGLIFIGVTILLLLLSKKLA